MKTQHHILNGDSLKKQLPSSILGNVIVARECLVDGNVEGKDLDELFATRAQFISQNYGGSKEDYYDKAVSEFQKIQNIDADSEINLWFEDDLFCQVNFWFVVYLLVQKKSNNKVFLIRPVVHSQYGFGGLNEDELISLYSQRIELTKLNKVANLWNYYQDGDLDNLLNIAYELEEVYPFFLPAVKAHIDRIKENRPTKTVLEIMKELNTQEFGPIFKEFCRREPIYGFGDLQVKRLLKEVIDKS